MEIAGDQRLRRNAAAGPDHFNRKTLVAMIALFDGDELIHVASGYGRDGETDLLFGASEIYCCRGEMNAKQHGDQGREFSRLHDAVLIYLRIRASRETRYLAEMHRTFGDDADLDAIAKRIVTVCSIGVRLMPGNELWIGAPIGFFSIEAF